MRTCTFRNFDVPMAVFRYQLHEHIVPIDLLLADGRQATTEFMRRRLGSGIAKMHFDDKFRFHFDATPVLRRHAINLRETGF